jgi:hypothetical protein
MDGGEPGRVPTSYKAWVFGSKLAGVLVFAVGIEMLTRGEPLWATLLLLAGAVVVLAPVMSPEKWDQRTGRRV